MINEKFNNIFNNIIYFVTLFLFINSGFYFSRLPYIAPVYIAFYVALPFTLIFIFMKNSIKMPLSNFLGLLFVAYIIFTQLAIGGKTIAILGSAATVTVFIIGTILLNNLSYHKVVKIVDIFLFYSLGVYLIDTFYRIIYAHFNIVRIIFDFYVIKKHCLFYSDTNPLAINTTLLTFFAIYLYNKLGQKKYLYLGIIFIILTILTMSRSAIIATAISMTVYILYRNLGYLRKHLQVLSYNVPLRLIFTYIFIFIITIVSAYLLIYTVNFLSVDASFSTKIELINTVHNFLTQSSLNELLLGVGFNNGGISDYGELGYAHSYLATYVVETGLLGYTIMTAFLFSIFVKTPQTIYIFLPFVIMGFSHISHAQLHLFYVSLAFIWYLDKSQFEKGANDE